ncbi:MAG TPA: hypothetical protein VFA67_05775 [Candidatus Sulfotelmatobacter sp.]|nr:hypothetical protein [Candidatus Sulfotelmatobacter sp.]
MTTLPSIRFTILVGALALGSALAMSAQETVFNVPSADILDSGKIYGELDFTYNPASAVASYTPRLVVGIGHRIEIGANLNGIATPADVRTTVTPALKWKIFDTPAHGFAVLVGDNVFMPVQNTRYKAGNYFYAELAKTWRAKTRLSAGLYHFTADVVAPSQRVGGQFGIEQPVGSRITLAADWYTGYQVLGYVTPGIIVKATSRLTLYGSWQIGNYGLSEGNHQLLVELGWNFN